MGGAADDLAPQQERLVSQGQWIRSPQALHRYGLPFLKADVLHLQMDGREQSGALRTSCLSPSGPHASLLYTRAPILGTSHRKSPSCLLISLRWDPKVRDIKPVSQVHTEIMSRTLCLLSMVSFPGLCLLVCRFDDSEGSGQEIKALNTRPMYPASPGHS